MSGSNTCAEIARLGELKAIFLWGVEVLEVEEVTKPQSPQITCVQHLTHFDTSSSITVSSPVYGQRLQTVIYLIVAA